jgi:hypothetical protein
MPVLIQYAEDDGPVHIHHIWDTPVDCTLDLIEWMMSQEVCGFNLAFDHFQLCKLYTIWRLIPEEYRDWEYWRPYMYEFIDVVASLERKARFGPCLKPKAACDLMLIAREGEFQSTMDRRDIRIHRVPVQIAAVLRDELEERIHFDNIYFARRKKDKYTDQWKIFPRDDTRNFVDIVVKFAASSALKNIIAHALGKQVITYGEATAQLDKTAYPEEFIPVIFGNILTNQKQVEQIVN